MSFGEGAHCNGRQVILQVGDHPRPVPDPNAFATGTARNSALVAISAGLLNQMKPNEVEAVLAHEIGHVVNRTILGNRQGHGIAYFITSLVAQVVLGILASTIVCWLSRKREFRADVAGVRLGGKENMTAALRDGMATKADIAEFKVWFLLALFATTGLKRQPNFAQILTGGDGVRG